jgi:RHS repeat-associated protein
VAAGTSGSRTQPFRHTGERWGSETGFTYLRARYYASSVGRFTSRDALAGVRAVPGSLNRYAYAGNNLINWTDPSGMITFGYCATGSIGSGLNVTGQVCPLQISGAGEFGWSASIGIGGASTPEAGVGGGVQVTSAETLSQLKGTEIYAGVVSGLGPGFQLTGAHSPADADTSSPAVWGATLTVGPTYGAGVVGGVSQAASGTYFTVPIH